MMTSALVTKTDNKRKTPAAAFDLLDSPLSRKFIHAFTRISSFTLVHRPFCSLSPSILQHLPFSHAKLDLFLPLASHPGRCRLGWRFRWWFPSRCTLLPLCSDVLFSSDFVDQFIVFLTPPSAQMSPSNGNDRSLPFHLFFRHLLPVSLFLIRLSDDVV